MNPSKAVFRRRSWVGKALFAGEVLAFLGLGAWATTLVRRSHQVQMAFDRAGGQAVQMTGLLDGLNRLHQAGSAVLQSYAVGYQRVVFEKTYDQYLDKRLAPKIPWDPSCQGCLKALDGAVKAHQAQALRVFEVGDRWEALPPGPAKEQARGAMSDELFALERAQGNVLTAFQSLEASNRDLVASALLDHQYNARQVYAFAGTTLLLALGFLGVASLAWIQTRRTRLAERLTRTLMDVVPDGLLVWNDARILIKANPTACLLLGKSEKDLLGQPVAQWVPPQIQECLEDPLTAQGVPFSLSTAPQSSVPLEASAGCLRTREGNVHVGIFRDISQRVEAERQMREAQKLEAVGALAAGVVHDVKNLLTPIGLAEEILSSEPDLSPAEHRLLGQIHKSTEAATSLMNQLLRFAKKDAQEPAQVIDVESCIQETFSLVGLHLGPRITIETGLDAESHHVKGRHEQVVQVFSNLFINAAQAMHGEGRLRVETSTRGTVLEVRVSDSGEGMSSAVQARAFEPLFTTKGVNGTGLGLFTVKQILEGMGSTIQVESALGFGTTFILRIPIHEPISSAITILPDGVGNPA